MKTVITLLTAASLLLVACGSKSSQPLADGGGSGDAQAMDAAPTDAAFDGGVATPIVGGGAGGGSINGHIIVFVIDHATRSPISGAVVEVEAQPNAITAMTGSDGRADLGAPGLKGPANVHVFATGYPYESIIGINAMELTFEISKPVVTKTSTGTITGNVAGWDLLPVTTSTQTLRFGSVQAMTKHLLDAAGNGIAQDVRATAPIPANVAIQGLFEDYALKVAPEATAGVSVLGGLLTLHARGQPTVEVTHIGFLAPVNATVGTIVSGQNITFTHPLNQHLSITLQDAPNLSPKQVLAEVALPNNGGFAPLAVGMASKTGTASISAPALTGALNGGGYVIAAFVGDAATQSSIALSRNNTTTTTISVSGFLAPPTMVTASHRMLSATPSPNATTHSFAISKTGQLAWTINVLGGGALMLTLPAVPTGFVDPLTGMATLVVSATKFDGTIDFNNSSALDYQDHATAFASTSQSVTF
jgi:hypothetical protein